MKKEFKITVRELVQQVLNSGDLTFGFFGSKRPIEGIHLHQKIQRSRPENYSSEVPVSHQIETEKLTLTVSGRIDGVYENPDHVIIEEIKTTSRDLDYFKKNENPHHWGQAKIYAFLYGFQHGFDKSEKIDVKLVYYQIDTNEIQEFVHSFLMNELKAHFQSLVSKYLDRAKALAEWCLIRDESIRSLEFPFDSYRPGQRRVAEKVFLTIKNDGQLLIQAATGMGKTMAVIFPSVKAIAEGLSQKIFYLTARTTGRSAAELAIEELRKNGLRLKSLSLTAKEKICFNPDKPCHPDECTYARGHFDRISDALENIFQKDIFDRETIRQKAREYRVCPFEFSLDISMWADVIICDYNYAFDPRVFLRRFFQDSNDDYTFLIDEAHNLVDRSREMFSAEFLKQTILDVRRPLKTQETRIYKSLGKINSWLLNAKKKNEESSISFSEKDPPEDLYPLLRKFLRITERWLTLNIKTSFREDLLTLFFTISGFLRVSEQFDESYSTCYETIGRDLRLKLFCIDPSGNLKQALTRSKTTVFFSATLTPINYFKSILGCEDHADILQFPSPFPKENLGLFLSGNISTLYRQRENTKLHVARAILTLVKQKRGNYLLFFPSFEYMMMVYEVFHAESPGLDTIVQTRGMTEPERDTFLKRFAQKNSDILAGFAAMGGIFGEGIDLVGDRLSGTAIIGVGLPSICLERELIKEYFARDLQAGFEYAYLYPGISRVLQAAGRVIRTEHDRGVILLIDQRYNNYNYKSLLPGEWEITSVQDEQQLAKGLQKFWNNKD
ncbi:helicase C-terminal domain-containing protein [Thermodesulfobacteriota bacterium]